MKKDHLPPDLRIKVNYLRKLGCQIHNDRPGGNLIIDCPYWPQEGPDSQGVIYLQDDIDSAIKYAEVRNPAVASVSRQQIKLFNQAQAANEYQMAKDHYYWGWCLRDRVTGRLVG